MTALRLKTTRLAILLVLAAACGGSTPPPSAASTSTEPIDSAACTKIAEVAHEACDDDTAKAFEQCQAQARFAEAGGCLTQGHRAYDCTMKKLTACSAPECCVPDVCADDNLALENCLRGYCSGHGGNPDCVEFFGAPAPPVSAEPPPS